MSTPNDGGPAFPNPGHDNGPGNYRGRPADGMSLRDYFAAKAMQAIVCDPHHVTYKREGYEAVSGYAYALADAMLEERSKA